jgi:hypothetical protein
MNAIPKVSASIDPTVLLPEPDAPITTIDSPFLDMPRCVAKLLIASPYLIHVRPRPRSTVVTLLAIMDSQREGSP